ncbi:hypothetical protein C8Q78DRAFT_456538 [Trametes maxima]|nr:hypothetical protein C8Q78DRAFT_456538 [Trametes maxima]
MRPSTRPPQTLELSSKSTPLEARNAAGPVLLLQAPRPHSAVSVPRYFIMCLSTRRPPHLCHAGCAALFALRGSHEGSASLQTVTINPLHSYTGCRFQRTSASTEAPRNARRRIHGRPSLTSRAPSRRSPEEPTLRAPCLDSGGICRVCERGDAEPQVP